jgi:hypothetical protein
LFSIRHFFDDVKNTTVDIFMTATPTYSTHLNRFYEKKSKAEKVT